MFLFSQRPVSLIHTYPFALLHYRSSYRNRALVQGGRDRKWSQEGTTTAVRYCSLQLADENMKKNALSLRRKPSATLLQVGAMLKIMLKTKYPVVTHAWYLLLLL